MRIHTALLLTLAASLAACAMLKRGVWTGGGAAGGAALGSMAGPAGTIGGAAIGGIAGQSLGENDDLRSGELKGEESYVKEIERLRLALANRPVVPVETPVPFIPRWIWWALGAYLAFTKGHHLLAFVKTREFTRLLNIFLPSWAQRKRA